MPAFKKLLLKKYNMSWLKIEETVGKTGRCGVAPLVTNANNCLPVSTYNSILQKPLKKSKVARFQRQIIRWGTKENKGLTQKIYVSSKQKILSPQKGTLKKPNQIHQGIFQQSFYYFPINIRNSSDILCKTDFTLLNWPF